jgi:hypothetical protein
MKTKIIASTAQKISMFIFQKVHYIFILSLAESVPLVTGTIEYA